jgi:hypothetical protein
MTVFIMFIKDKHFGLVDINVRGLDEKTISSKGEASRIVLLAIHGLVFWPQYN